MLRKKDSEERTSRVVLLFRLLHGVCFLYGLAILGLTLTHAQTTLISPSSPYHAVFGIVVAIPIILGSGFSFLALVIRFFCSIAVFFCAVLACVFLGLPLMMTVFFPMHLLLLGFAGMYLLSGVVIVRHCCLDPIAQKQK